MCRELKALVQSEIKSFHEKEKMVETDFAFSFFFKSPAFLTSISFLFSHQKWEEDPSFLGVQTPQDSFKLSEGTSLDP